MVCSIEGTYLGYLNFDNRRYWSYDKILPLKLHIKKSVLKSDHNARPDMNFLKMGELVEAQMAKERLEAIQRRDAKLRK